jgi:hypothetical protein
VAESQLALVAVPRSTSSVTASPLASCSICAKTLDAGSRRALERWHVDSGFAETNGEPGLLVLTQLGIEVGAASRSSGRHRAATAR